MGPDPTQWRSLVRADAAAVAADAGLAAQACRQTQAWADPRQAMERAPVTAYIGLGANLGDPARTLQLAIQALQRVAGLSLLRTSSLYKSTPHQAEGPDFINAVACLSSSLDPIELLSALQAIEQAFGRERPYPNSPRTLDLDLLLYGSARIDSSRLQIPHPRMLERAFVLAPLAQIAPELVDAGQLQAVAGQKVTLLETPAQPG